MSFFSIINSSVQVDVACFVEHIIIVLKGKINGLWGNMVYNSCISAITGPKRGLSLFPRPRTRSFPAFF